MATVQTDEPGMTHHLKRYQAVMGSLEHRHPLGATRTDRLHQPASNPELADKRFRDLWKGRRHQDRVVRRSRRHAFRAVSVNNLDVPDVLCHKVSPSHFGKV